MRKTLSLFLTLALTVLLSACTGAAESEEAGVSEIYTAVASTMTAQATALQPTPTIEVTPSRTPQDTPTSEPTPVEDPTSAPQQNISVSSGSTSVSVCDNSAYVSDVTIPDGTTLAPGESFTKTWKLQNTGTCTWSTSYKIAFVSGDKMSGSATALTVSASPDDQIKVSISLTAPTSTGTYTGYWKLKNEDGEFFGQSVYVQVVVSDDEETVTPTATDEDEEDDEDEYTATPTTESTSTAEPTSTPEPTATTESAEAETESETTS